MFGKLKKNNSSNVNLHICRLLGFLRVFAIPYRRNNMQFHLER